MNLRLLMPLFDEVYERYARRDLVVTDPLVFLYRFDDPGDREVVGFLAASLAYGRVAQINKSIAAVLEKMGTSPRRFVAGASRERLTEIFGKFKHRFTTGHELADMLCGMRHVLELHGSLRACMATALDSDRETILPALSFLIDEIRHGGGVDAYNSLLPSPVGGSACKRLNLFLRWMVRKDDVDPGGWEGIAPSMLVTPLDTHMYRLGCALGMTQRRQADMKTALEITNAFKTILPHDPVRYDFALTRLGICPELDAKGFVDACRAAARTECSSQ